MGCSGFAVFSSSISLHSCVATFAYSSEAPQAFQELGRLLRRHLFLKLFLKRGECRVFWACQSVGRFVVTSPVPSACSCPSHMSFCVINAAVLCALSLMDPWVRMVYLGFSTQHKTAFGSGEKT